VAVADSKFVVNYFRLSEDRRLLFGGGESYGYRFPADIAAAVRKPMLQVYPQLKDVRGSTTPGAGRWRSR
jgi:gamma-glutamylputrescine oxidase